MRKIQTLNEQLNRMKGLMDFKLGQNSHDTLSDKLINEQKDINISGLMKEFNLYLDKILEKAINQGILTENKIKISFPEITSNDPIILNFGINPKTKKDQTYKLNKTNTTNWEISSNDVFLINLNETYGDYFNLNEVSDELETFLTTDNRGQALYKHIQKVPLMVKTSGVFQQSQGSGRLWKFSAFLRNLSKKEKRKLNTGSFDEEITFARLQQGVPEEKYGYWTLTWSEIGVDLYRYSVSENQLVKPKKPTPKPTPEDDIPVTPTPINFELVDVFDYDSTDVKDPESYQNSINDLIVSINTAYKQSKEKDKFIKELNGYKIVGYASQDNDPKENKIGKLDSCQKTKTRGEYNQCLSEKRAEKVVNDINEKLSSLGINFKSEGMGETTQFGGNGWSDGKQDDDIDLSKNRKIVLIKK